MAERTRDPKGGDPPGFRPPDVKLPDRWAWYLLLGVLAVLALLALRSSVYTVATDEQAVVLRLGRLQGISEPGFHFKLPFGLDEVHLVPTKRVLKEEFGFRTVRADARSQFAKQPFTQESLTLTGDLNIADVEWIVQYRISDPALYWFQIEEPAQTVRDMSEAVLRQVIGSRTVDQVLTVGRSEIEAEAQRLLQKQMIAYKSGLSIVALQLRNVTPPEPVQASFNDVNRSEQDREKLIDQARAAYNREIPAAEGEALRTVEQARGQAIDRVNRAKGDANRFLAILAEYRKSPDVTRRRLYLETMGAVLPAVSDLTVLDGATGGNVLPFLDLKKGGAQ